MPFIKQERRKIIKKKGLNGLKKYPKSWIEPGDRCYVYYKPMVDKWKANPRWSTAHGIYKELYQEFPLLVNGEKDWESMVARDLAWQVFFQLYVMPYELKKREENGDIW